MSALQIALLIIRLEPAVRDLVVSIIAAIQSGDHERAQELAANAAKLRGQAAGFSAYRASRKAGK